MPFRKMTDSNVLLKTNGVLTKADPHILFLSDQNTSWVSSI